MSSSKKRNVRKAVVAGAAVIGVGLASFAALSGGTGADFTASDTGQVDIHTATLNIGLTDDAGSVGTFNLDFSNLKPGEVQHKKFYVTNTGSIAADVKVGNPIQPSALGSGLSGSDYAELSAGISGITSLTSVASLPASGWNLGSLAAGETKAYTLDIGLAQAAGNEWQNQHIGASVTVALKQQ